MPTWNSPVGFLQQAIGSVRSQFYDHWELCIADDASNDPEVLRVLETACAADPRIRLVKREANGHICAASNSALALATGEYVGLLDHDDLLHPMALWWVARTIAQHPEADLIYSDEDKLDADGRRFGPYFKSDFNYELLLSQNMISHFGVYRRRSVEAIGGFRVGLEGSQDYDLALRIVEQSGRGRIQHIPRVLYHWRVHDQSTSSSSHAKPYAWQAGRRALEDHLVRSGLTGTVVEAPEVPNMYRVRFDAPENGPAVLIIVRSTQDSPDPAGALASVRSRSTYPRYRIEGAGAAGQQPHRIGEAVEASDADYLVLLDGALEVMTPGWIEEMLSHACRSGVGCVGARIWTQQNRLCEGGYVLGGPEMVFPAHRHVSRGSTGYFGRASLLQEFSAVSSACLMISRAAFLACGGLSERLTGSLADADFGLRVRELGLRNVWTPFAEFRRMGSARGLRWSYPASQSPPRDEIEFMRARWRSLLDDDPFYSPHLSRFVEDFSLA